MTSVLGRPQTGEPGGNSQCAHWCADNFANPGEDCTSLAAHGGGPCYVCGPLKTSPSEELCNAVCTDTNTDNNNCGKCGTKVSYRVIVDSSNFRPLNTRTMYPIGAMLFNCTLVMIAVFLAATVRVPILLLTM